NSGVLACGLRYYAGAVLLVRAFHKVHKISIMGLVRQTAARNRDILSGDIAAFVRRQIDDQRCNIFRFPEFWSEYVALNNFFESGHGPFQGLGEHDTRCYAVTADI